MFLSPEWYNGSLFWMNSVFKTVWILVSNIVYFIFAIILIWIAFMNIIWKNEGVFQLKQALPKFVVWVLIVPLSWFIVQFILSLASILTVMAVTFPADNFETFGDNMEGLMIPKQCTINLSSGKDITDTSTEDEKKNSKDPFFICDSYTKTTITGNRTWTMEIHQVLSTYIYAIVKLDKIALLEEQDIAQWITKLSDILVKLSFDLIFVVIYVILMWTLCVVLLIRGIYVWLFIMLSPLFWLMYFFDKNSWSGEWFINTFNIKNFFALAMVPVYTMFALSFWLLFLHVVWTWMWWDGQNVATTDQKLIKIWYGNSVNSVGDVTCNSTGNPMIMLR